MTLDTILTAIKNLCSISGTAYDTFLTQEVNFGQQDFSREINWPFLEARGSVSSVQYKSIYDLASNFDTIKSVIFQKNHFLQPVNWEQFNRLNKYASYGTPRYYTIREGKLYVWPAPDADAATTTLGAAITSTTAATVTLVSVSNLEDKGRILVDSEVIEYSHITTASLRLDACRRGQEGTTAATHLIAATVTYRDIEYDYYKTLADLSGTDTSSIPARYHEALCLYAASRFFEKTEDLAQANNLFQRYLIIREQAKKDLGEKIVQRFSTVLDDSTSNVTLRDNTWPENSSLT